MSSPSHLDKAQAVFDIEIAALQRTRERLDGVFDQVERGDAEARASAAFREWKALNVLMSPGEQREVFLVCVRDSWPQWIVQRAAGRRGLPFPALCCSTPHASTRSHSPSMKPS